MIRKNLKRLTFFLLILTWMLMGWPSAWQNLGIPSDIQEAQASTSLTAYLTSTNTTTTLSSTARQLINSAPASETSVTTKVGKTTQYCELFARGSTTTCSGVASAPNPSGNGFVWDVTSLEAQQFLSGNWTGAMKLKTSVSSGISVTALMRAYKLNGSTYTLIATSTAASQSLTSTAAALTFSAGSGSVTTFNTGDKLYIDFIVDITANTANSSTATISLFENGGAAEQMITPSYQPAVPTVTTQAASSVKDSTAVANGNVTDTGGLTVDKEGFVYDTATKNLPGNVVPGSSGYASFTENTGSFGTGAFTVSLTGLTGGITYFGRAYSHNSAGYSYGSEISFTTAIISITVTSNGIVSYGTIAVNTSKDTTLSGLNNTQTVKNGSTIAEDFNIEGQNNANWTLSGTSGTNQYVHKFSTNSGSSWTALTTSYQALATNIAASGTQNFDLQLTTPSSTSFYTQQSVDVTIQAVAH